MDIETIDLSLVKGYFEGLRPEPRYLLSEWADEHRYLSSESSAEPGRFKTSRTPYLREIMDNLSMSSPYQQIILKKGVQLGASELAYNLVGYCIDIAPCPILYVLPTVEMCRTNSKTRLAPMIEASPRLRKKVAPARTKDADNTILEKFFPGGMFRFGGANSAAGLRNMPIRVLILDEPDAYPLDLDGEGSAVSLAEKRTNSFGARKKIYKLSTPTMQATSVIEKEYLNSTQNRYHVPCPYCGTFQTLEFIQLKWDKGKYNTVKYICSHCGENIEERHKTQMLGAGIWKPDAPQNADGVRISYWINSLYSPLGWYSWNDVAREWEDAQNDVNLLKTFVNTVLAECWEDKGEVPDWQRLYDMARITPYEQGKIPDENVAFLTAGVDIQRDRIELEVVGWYSEKRSYSVDYKVLLGDTSLPEVWANLTKTLSEQYLRVDGMFLPIAITAIDSGYNSQMVYSYCAKFDASKIFPVKGTDNQAVMVTPPRSVNVTRAGKKIGGVKLWHVGVGIIKSELYGWLRQERGTDDVLPPGFCRFPQYDQHYFKGLTAEQLTFTVSKQGYRKYQWIKKYDRNEPLDLRVYNRVAAHVYGIDRFTEETYITLANSYEKPIVKAVPDKPKKKSFWD